MKNLKSLSEELAHNRAKQDQLREQAKLVEGKLRAVFTKEQKLRFSIVGRVVLQAIENDPALRSTVTALLASDLKKNCDRELFALPPLLENPVPVQVPGKSPLKDKSASPSFEGNKPPV